MTTAYEIREKNNTGQASTRIRPWNIIVNQLFFPLYTDSREEMKRNVEHDCDLIRTIDV